MTVLVTGGAGYIGAHVVRLLVERGTRVVVVDDVSTGARDRVSGAPLEALDLTDVRAADRLVDIAERHDVDAIIHLAAFKAAMTPVLANCKSCHEDYRLKKK